MSEEVSYDERFVHFVVLFNVDKDYYECHEVMEELWLEEGRNLLYQGLLQAAVGLHHWRNDNFSGAVKLFTQAENKLMHYPDHAMGLDLGQLRMDVARSLAPLRVWVEGAVNEGEASIAGKAGIAGKASIAGEAGKAGIAEAAADTVDGGERKTPPPFQSFSLAVTDEELRQLVEAMAQIPLEQRLHGEG
ncbi:hypothetical protein PAECIP111893_02272 [Paenibacillus plantiphilus]|uniref:DUF309 domain-containing protein n=1 Tax=Paenibacillus plantiphilus TaxID=2905650 RepID=A0ABN8GET9_9BACL|nr:DUF309 domain-containing protein [Paenibacillus plantiphilus]CAH1204524.1 hypothetical protein PAECIP111893_02272 [Paenibacillus plantiphilus]